jgi:hypothetical protein
VVWYFHTRRPYRSLPYIFWVTASVASALRWTAPREHPASQVPWLEGLVTGFDDVLDEVTENFLPQPLPDPPAPAPCGRFRELACGSEADDEAGRLVGRFLHVERWMHGLAGVEVGPPDEDRYHRYVDWNAFTGRARAFVELASRDLGIDPHLMYEDPQRVQT